MAKSNNAGKTFSSGASKTGTVNSSKFSGNSTPAVTGASSKGGGSTSTNLQIGGLKFDNKAEMDTFLKSNVGNPYIAKDIRNKTGADTMSQISNLADFQNINAPMDLSKLNQPTVNYDTIPTPKTDAFSGLFDGALASTKYEAPKVETEKTDAQRILETMAADKPESQADLLKQMKKQAGIAQMEARANDLKSQIEMEQARTQANLLKLRGVGGAEGVTEAVYGGQQAQIDRESAIRLLPLTAQYNAELGRLESAEKNIRELFGAIVADQQNQRSYRQNLYSMAYTMARDDQKDLLDKAKEETRKRERQEDIFLDMKKQQADVAMKAGDYKLAGEILTAKDMATVNAKTAALGGGGIPEQVQKSKDQFSFLRDTIKGATDLADATGPNLLTQGLGNIFVGNTQVKQLQKKLDTLKVNLLTLNTDPAVKKFFGPQMTERDTELMTSAGTTMDAYVNTPKDLKAELKRYDDLINRMQTAVQIGESGGRNVLTGPDGEIYEIID